MHRRTTGWTQQSWLIWMRSSKIIRTSDLPMPKSQQSCMGLGPIPSSSVPVESKGRQMKQCRKNLKNRPLKTIFLSSLVCMKFSYFCTIAQYNTCAQNVRKNLWAVCWALFFSEMEPRYTLPPAGLGVKNRLNSCSARPAESGLGWTLAHLRPWRPFYELQPYSSELVSWW